MAITDKFGRASKSNTYSIATTVKTARSAGVLVLEAFDLSRFADDTPVFFITYKKSIDPVTGDVLVTDLVSWKALVNVGANTLTNMLLAPGYTDAGNDVGDFIECIPTSYWENSLIDGILTSLNPDGTIKNGTVGAGQIQDGSVGTTELANGSVTPEKLVAGTGSSWGWLDYTATSTIVGFSSITNKVIWYKQIGKTVHVVYAIDGVSNATNVTFTLPIAAKIYSGGLFNVGPEFATGLCSNNGATDSAPGRGLIDSTLPNTVVISRLAGSAGFTPSGAKAVRGTFTYEAA